MCTGGTPTATGARQEHKSATRPQSRSTSTTGKTQNVLIEATSAFGIHRQTAIPITRERLRQTAAVGAELMTAAAHNDALPAAPVRFGARELVLLGLLGAATATVGWLAPGLLPLAVAGGVAAMVPSKHDWTTRAVARRDGRASSRSSSRGCGPRSTALTRAALPRTSP